MKASPLSVILATLACLNASSSIAGAAADAGYPAPPGVYGQSGMPTAQAGESDKGTATPTYVFIEKQPLPTNNQTAAFDQPDRNSGQEFRSKSDNLLYLSPQIATPVFRPLTEEDGQTSDGKQPANPVHDQSSTPVNPPAYALPEQRAQSMSTRNLSTVSEQPALQLPVPAAPQGVISYAPQEYRSSYQPNRNMQSYNATRHYNDYGYSEPYGYNNYGNNRYFNFAPSGPSTSYGNRRNFGFFDFNAGNTMNQFFGNQMTDSWLPPANNYLKPLDVYPVPQNMYGQDVPPPPPPQAMPLRHDQDIIYPPSYPRD